MSMVGTGLAQSLDAFIERLPHWRDLPVIRRKAALPAESPFALACLIEGEIIPRLLVAHRANENPERDTPRPLPAPLIGGAEVEAFAMSALQLDAYGLLQLIENFLDRGVAVETILVELLAPTARRLGEYWDEDRCDFIAVTMGLWRLQELVHELGSRMPIMNRHGDERSALFAVVPGDQHSLGITILDELFRTAGWSTTCFGSGTSDELVELVRNVRFDLIGLTITSAENMEQAPAIIAGLRQNSRNPGVIIMVGGRILAERPELAMAIGADGTAPDARAAVVRAEVLLRSLATATTTRC